MHSRMRSRVAEFLKVLNRAKPDPATADTGKTAGKTARFVPVLLFGVGGLEL